MNDTAASPAGRQAVWLVPGLLVLLGVATLGEGGARPGVLLGWHALLVFLLLVVLLVPEPRDSVRRRTHPLTLAGVGPLVALVLVGALFAPYGFAAWLAVLELGAFLGVVVLAARRGPTILERALDPLLAFAAMLGATALWQRLELGISRPAASFLNPNHLAGWVVAVLLLAAGCAFGGGRRDWRIVAYRSAAAALIVAVLLVTGSRGAVLSLFVGLATIAVLRRDRLSRRAQLAAAGVLLLVALLGVGAQALRLRESDPFRYQRVRIWRASATLVERHPWSGTGPRQFAAASRAIQFPDGDGPLRYDRTFSFPHSDLLRVACELGWPGVAALALAVLAVAGVVLSRRRTGGLTLPAVGAVAALVGLATQAAVDHVSHRPAMYLLGAFLLGALSSQRVPASPRYPAWLRGGSAALLVTVFLIGDLAPYLAWSEFAGLPRGALGPAEQRRLRRAIELNPLQPEYWSRRAAHFVDDGNALDLDAYARAREAAERALRLQPVDAEFHRGLARVEAQACRYLFRDVATRERARREFEAAARLAPHDPFIQLELSAFLLDTDDPPGARRAAESALAIEPESVAPRLLLADALLAEGGPGAAERAGDLLDAARERALRWRRWLDRGPYARQLLQLDSRRVGRLRDALDTTTRTVDPEDVRALN